MNSETAESNIQDKTAALSIISSTEISGNNQNEFNSPDLCAWDVSANSKREELENYEKRLQEYEKSIISREKQMKNLLQAEYERLITYFDENYQDRVNNMHKRLINHEKSVKTKIKQYETQIRERKFSSNSSGAAQEKLQIKISSLEKSNDFLKLKVQELEKLVTQEQESKQMVLERNKKLLKKVTLLEKTLKEFQGGQIPILDSASDQTEIGLASEKPLEVIDLNASQPKELEKEIRSENRLSSESAEAEDKEEENSVKLKKTLKGGSVMETSVPIKKKTSASKIVSSSSEIKVLLNVLHSLVVCLKSTLPAYIKEERPGREEEERKEEAGRHELTGEKVDVGEVFYPCFDGLIANLTELLPIIGKPYDVKYISSMMELYFKLLNFFFKFKVQHAFENKAQSRLLSEFDIQNSMEKIKTSQDHVNEIMIGAHSAKGSIDVTFLPQTEYWKKIVKTTKPLVKGKATSNIPNPLIQSLTAKPNTVQPTNKINGIQLFAEEIVQKEVLSVLKKFLDSTEFMLKAQDKGSNLDSNIITVVTFHTKLNLETQKYLQITRMYSSLVGILLAKTKREQVFSLQSIIFDLNIDNEKIAEFLSLFFIENDGLNILFWLAQNSIDDSEILQLTLNILQTLNHNGAHYKSFIENMRKEENLKIILDMLMRYKPNTIVWEKGSSIVESITAQGVTLVSEAHLKFLKAKLSELEASQSDLPLITNLKSILSNLKAM